MTRLTVNNEAVEYLMPRDTPLLWALRDGSNLTGAKYGCDDGGCGACTVDVDGRAVRSCTVALAQVEGAYVTTIEGLSRDRSHPVQLAMIADNVSQCGFCIPGIVMTVAVMLKRDGLPDEAAIGAAVTNLCPCGIHPRLIGAIQRAARAIRGDEPIPETSLGA